MEAFNKSFYLLVHQDGTCVPFEIESQTELMTTMQGYGYRPGDRVYFFYRKKERENFLARKNK